MVCKVRLKKLYTFTLTLKVIVDLNHINLIFQQPSVCGFLLAWGIYLKGSEMCTTTFRERKDGVPQKIKHKLNG